MASRTDAKTNNSESTGCTFKTSTRSSSHALSVTSQASDYRAKAMRLT